MALVTELKLLIQTYLPLKVLQLLNDSGYIINDLSLIKFKYDLNPDVITNQNNFLTNFERYTDIAMLHGEIGYNGQFYLPPYVALLYSIRINDLQLINYYLLRYFVARNWIQSMLYLGWDLDHNLYNYPSTFLALMFNMTTKQETKYFLQQRLSLFGYNNKLKIYNDVKLGNLDFINVNKPVTASLLALYAIKPDLLDVNMLDQLSLVNFMNLILYIKASYGCITKDLLLQAQTMLDLLINTCNNLTFYSDVLKILLNYDINVNNYSSDYDKVILFGFALSVANGKVIKTIFNIPGFNILHHPNLFRTIIPSQVFYDFDYLLTTYKRISENTKISIFLTNLTYYYLTKLNNQDRVIKVPIIDKYDALVEASKSNYYSRVYDPETALRLSSIINVKPFLQPMNQFDQHLMQQFGLL